MIPCECGDPMINICYENQLDQQRSPVEHHDHEQLSPPVDQEEVQQRHQQVSPSPIHEEPQPNDSHISPPHQE